MQSRKLIPVLPVPDAGFVPVGPDAAMAIAEIHRRSDPPGWSVESWEKQLSQGSVHCLSHVGVRGLDGFVAVSIAGGEAEVLMIAVDQTARGAGLGRRLMEYALGHAAMLGARQCFLEVAADNQAAKALYARCGFAETAVRKGYYARPGGYIDALVMARDLGNGAEAG